MKIKIIGFEYLRNTEEEQEFANGKPYSVRPIIIDFRKMNRYAPSCFDGSERQCILKAKELTQRLINCRGQVHWHRDVIWE